MQFFHRHVILRRLPAQKRMTCVYMIAELTEFANRLRFFYHIFDAVQLFAFRDVITWFGRLAHRTFDTHFKAITKQQPQQRESSDIHG